MKDATAAKSSSFVSFVPLSWPWGQVEWAIFGERHSVWIWLSLVVMLIGLALVLPKRHKRAAPAV